MSKINVYVELAFLRATGNRHRPLTLVYRWLSAPQLNIIFSSHLDPNFLSWKDFSCDGLRPTLWSHFNSIMSLGYLIVIVNSTELINA